MPAPTLAVWRYRPRGASAGAYHPGHHRPAPADLSDISDVSHLGRRSRFQRFFGGLRAQRENSTTGFTTGLNRVYYISLIDVLQTYDASKKTERMLKVGILKPLQSLFGASGAGGAEMDARRQRVKRAKSMAKKGFRPKEGFAGLHEARCPYCGANIPISDAFHDHMVKTGVFGPVMCGNASPSKVCTGARHGFDRLITRKTQAFLHSCDWITGED